MLFPNTQRNHMLPSRWNQPPCMNIEVSTVHQCGSAVSTQRRAGPGGTDVPAGAERGTPAGAAPRGGTGRGPGSTPPTPPDEPQGPAAHGNDGAGQDRPDAR